MMVRRPFAGRTIIRQVGRFHRPRRLQPELPVGAFVPEEARFSACRNNDQGRVV
jgi:hypothetical protein